MMDKVQGKDMHIDPYVLILLISLVRRGFRIKAFLNSTKHLEEQRSKLDPSPVDITHFEGEVSALHPSVFMSDYELHYQDDILDLLWEIEEYLQ